MSEYTTVYIYTLADPDTGEVRYVGQTSRPEERIYEHIRDATPGAHRAHWLRSLRQRGAVPVMQVIDVCDQASADEHEQYWIRSFRITGAKLVNATDGGRGMRGYVMSQISRQKMSDQLRRQWQEGTRGWSPESLAKRSQTRTGAHHRDDSKVKMSKAKASLSDDDVREIRRLRNECNYSLEELRSIYGLAISTLCQIAKRQRYAHVE